MPRTSFVCVCAAVLIATGMARADERTFTIGPSTFNVVSGTPVTQTSASQPALTNVLGYALTSNWTAVSGSPFSNELRLSMTGPGGAASTSVPVGGTENGNPFTFPGSVNSAGAFTLLNAGTLPNFAAGAYSATFDTTFGGTTANLANSSITVYSNPTSVTGTTVGGPTFTRPAIAEFGETTATAGVSYKTNVAVVSTTGRYMFAEGYTGSGYDGVLYVYQGSFNPLSPTTNLIAAADNPQFSDVPSTLTAPLTAGTTYIFVSTGFDSTQAGAFQLFGAGPGVVTFNPVPEPGLIGLAATAVLGAGAWVRRFRGRKPLRGEGAGVGQLG